MDIKALLKRIEGGDRSAFAAVVEQFQRPLFGYLGRMGMSQGTAEEIAQETFLRAWSRLGDYDPGRAQFSTWLFTIARNLALHELSRAPVSHEVMTGEMPPEAASGDLQPADAVSEMQRRQRLRAALCEMPPTDRSALALAYFKELDLAAIARIEGCTLGAVKVRLHRARQQLRQLLEALPLLINYVRQHQVESFRIPSTSMEPSVLRGDFLFADKRYNCPGCKSAVQRGDIAIFTYPNNRTLYYIKRVIGLPGDSVRIKGHTVWVNDKSLTVEESKGAAGTLVTEAADGRQWQVRWTAADGQMPDVALTVPPGQVFVLGDNRDASQDTRSFGTVPLQDIVGKARQIWFSIAPQGVRWDRLGKVLD